MKQIMTKTAATAIAAIFLVVPAVTAHPGHDHSHSDHAVQEMPVQSGIEPLLVVGALVGAGLALLMICRTGIERNRRQ